jgi:fatty acid desaturase
MAMSVIWRENCRRIDGWNTLPLISEARFMASSIWRYPDGFLPNFLGLSYTFLGYFFGIFMLLQESIFWNIGGVLLVSHTLMCSAFFIHEFIHDTIFRGRSRNSKFVILLGWLNGACYAKAADLKHKHIRHHLDRADVITFDFKKFLSDRPKVQKLVTVLEWAYIPAVEFIMRAYVIVSAFTRGKGERRIEVSLMLMTRVCFLYLLALLSLKAVFLYGLSYLLFIHAMRFIDAYQHTYEAYAIEGYDEAPGIENRDQDYEYKNTYSNLVSTRYPLLNLLTLNFVYHNAHHVKTGVPWYELPALHQKLYGEGTSQVTPVRTLFANFHRYRVERVMSPDYMSSAKEASDPKDFIGAVGVSFLTAV